MIEAQAAVIVDLKSQCRALRQDLNVSQAEVKRLEQRPTRELLADVNAKLSRERKALRAAERRLVLMEKERSKLRRMLTLASRGYDEAAAAMKEAEDAAKASSTAENKARLRAAEIERDAAAQVALAQSEAAEWMEGALDAVVAAEVEKCGLRTEEQTVQSVRQQAEAGGEFSEPVRTMTGIVMAHECRSGTAIFRPDNASGKGRSQEYRAVVKSVKKSNLLSRTQLWQRSKHLQNEIARVSGGKEAAVAQTAHLINGNLDLFKAALALSRLAPPTPLNLEQWAELGTQVSGCLGEQIRTFFRHHCGNKFPTKAQIFQHYAKSHFAFHTFPYEAVDLVEKKTTLADGSVKVKMVQVSTHGVCGSVTDVGDVLVRVLRHHQAAGNIAYPENIPAGFVPFQLCLDAGAGTTKVILKLNIVKNSDSIKNLVLLAILSKAKDTYAAMAVAFKSVFDDFNQINAEGLWVKVGWRPALPLDHTIELFGAQLEPRLKQMQKQ